MEEDSSLLSSQPASPGSGSFTPKSWPSLSAHCYSPTTSLHPPPSGDRSQQHLVGLARSATRGTSFTSRLSTLSAHGSLRLDSAPLSTHSWSSPSISCC